MTPRNTPRTLRLAACLVAGLLVSGCFAPAGGSSTSDPAGSGDGGRLRVALAFPPTQNLSPHGQDAFTLSRLGVAEGLTRLDENGTPVPALARSWRHDGPAWLFTLREARFHDGGDVTAAAVADALGHAARAKPAPAALAGTTLTAEAVGDRQVRITTTAPDPVLPQRLSNPSLAVFSPRAYANSGTVDPVGTATGPFRLTKITGATDATAERFDDYWGGRAQLAGIDAKFVADGTARVNALRSGEVDIAEAVPVARIASLDPGTAQQVATARTTGLFLNTRSGPFTDPAVRAAARAAVDTSVLARDVFEGYADPARGVFGPALTWAQGKRVEPTGRAPAGRVDGVSITLATYDNRPELPEAAQVLQQQLQRAGFTVALEVRESARLLPDALAGKFDAVVGARNTMLDTGDPVSVLTSDFTCAGSYNLALLCDPGVDEAIARATTVTDPGKRQDAAMAAEAAILGTDAVVPLVHQQAVVGVRAPVRGVALDPYERALVVAGTRR
ncbi:MAG: ABC transporter substrate-binding protein [Saccharothrix sp.]|nr:ABC transporter substrate-binding protein [Saccharothrix sp.]